MKHKHLGALLALAGAAWLAWRYLLGPQAQAQGSAPAGGASGIYVPGASDAASQLVGTTIPLGPGPASGLTTATPVARPIISGSGASTGAYTGFGGGGGGPFTVRGNIP